MHAADFNKTALAALGSILFAMLLVAFSNLVFAPQRPAVPGYALPTSAAPSAAPAAAAAPPEEPLPALLAKADAKKGAQDAKVCTTCHTFEKGGAVKIGPPLWDVVGRPIASFPGFAYSDSVKALGGDWTYEKLDHWIGNPKGMASGTKMAFPGEKEAQKRADILAYLQTLSEKPVPFPTEASAK
jgi:cytochrome c